MTTDSASSSEQSPAKLSISLNGTFVKIVLALTAAGAVGGGSYVVGRQQEHVAVSRGQDSVGSLSRDELRGMIATGVSEQLGLFRAEFEGVKTQAKYAENLAQAAKNALDTTVKDMSDDVTDIKVMLAALKSRLETEDRINATKPK